MLSRTQCKLYEYDGSQRASTNDKAYEYDRGVYLIRRSPTASGGTPARLKFPAYLPLSLFQYALANDGKGSKTQKMLVERWIQTSGQVYILDAKQ